MPSRSSAVVVPASHVAEGRGAVALGRALGLGVPLWLGAPLFLGVPLVLCRARLVGGERRRVVGAAGGAGGDHLAAAERAGRGGGGDGGAAAVGVGEEPRVVARGLVVLDLGPQQRQVLLAPGPLLGGGGGGRHAPRAPPVPGPD